MDDRRLEDAVRRTLRNEADSLPFRLTAADVQRRLAAAQRTSSPSRALAALAAVLVIVASGLFIATTRPRPALLGGSPPASAAAPSASSSASVGTATRPPLGAAESMVLYRFERAVDDGSIDIVLWVQRSDGQTDAIGAIRSSMLPPGATINTEDPLGSRVRVSETGYAAVRYVLGEEATGAGHAIYDLNDLDIAPLVVDADGEAVWGPAGRLAIVGNDVTIVDTAERSAFTLRRPADVAVRSAWAADGSGLLSTRELGSEPVRYEVGVLSLDGRFTSLATVPPLYQATGLERPLGARGETVATACDQSGASPPPNTTGCFVVASDADGTLTRWVTGVKNRPFPEVVHWNSQGTALWALAPNPARPDGVELYAVVARDRLVENARTGVRNRPVYLVGVSSGDRLIVLLAPGHDQGSLITVRTENGSITNDGAGEMRIDGFAGWAAAQEPYPTR